MTAKAGQSRTNVDIRNPGAFSPTMVYNSRAPVTKLLSTGLLFVSGSLLLPIGVRAAVAGEVSGTVTDPRGSAVSGARLKLTDSAGTVRETTSDKQGSFTFEAVDPGTYRLTTESTGFVAEYF